MYTYLVKFVSTVHNTMLYVTIYYTTVISIYIVKSLLHVIACICTHTNIALFVHMSAKCTVYSPNLNTMERYNPSVCISSQCVCISYLA